MIRALFLSAAAFCATSASATEIQLGVAEHDSSILGLTGSSGKERSVTLIAGVASPRTDALDFILAPRLCAGCALNLEGETSYGGGGLLWRKGATDHFYIQGQLGLVVHNGTRDIPRPITPADVPAFEVRNSTEVEFGSRVLFDIQVAGGAKISDEWAAELFWQHLSHGNLLSSGPNEGLDSWGVRAVHRFGE